MSREIIVRFMDDLEPGTPATVTRTVALDDRIVELDLSEPSSVALDEMLEQVMKAGSRVKVLHPAQRVDEELPATGGRGQATRAYNAQMRAWAQLSGRGDEVKVNEHDGKNSGYSYSRELKRDFAEFMRTKGPGT